LSTLLQLPVLRLEQRIKQELELNPLLEIDTELEETMEQTEKEEKDSEEEIEDDEEEIKEETKEEEEVDWETIINDEDNYEIKRPREHREDDIIRPEPSPVTFMDHLFEQLHLEPITNEEMKIGEYILWCLDDDGYLSCDTDVIAENFTTTPDSVEKVLKVIQKFDPVGIGARNLRECLLIQLNESDEKDELAINMIEECLEDFSNKRFEKISKKLEISLSEVKRIMEVVTRLNPKPGEKYVSAAEHYISIYQRRATIQRVMESIIRQQKEFFDKGKEYLKPMILKDVAEDVNLDISTVSRVTSRKYVQTDFGVFELKYFFSERLETASGEDVSNKLIKAKIKKIIEEEDFKKPYNDQIISEKLKNEGFIVARRTVAKYREQMMIPVARLRRKI